MKYKKIKKANFMHTLVMIIIALAVFLILMLFFPSILHSFFRSANSVVSCGSSTLGVETECREECTGSWEPTPEGLVTNNCLESEGYICCMKTS